MQVKNKKSDSLNNQNFDVIIIGGGAAGMSAALWCDDLGLSALLLEKSDELGGQLLWTFNPIKNHLGVEAENGRALQRIFVKQMENRKFSHRKNSEVQNFDPKNITVSLTGGERFAAKAMIIATGVRRRKLNIEGENSFVGKGVLDSGKKNSEKVSKKTVLIVGGGDAAIENSLILSETARKVYIAHRRRDFRARSEFLEKARTDPKIEFLTEMNIRKITGSHKIETVELQNARTGEVRNLPVDFVLIRIGVEPNTELFHKELLTDKNGYLKVDENGETTAKNIFAVGDAANPVSPTISTAVGTGATAVKTIFSRLNL